MQFLFLISTAVGLAIDCDSPPFNISPSGCKQFHEFEEKFNRSYKDVEERLRRFENFIKNLVEMEILEKEMPDATFSYLTPFFDWSKKEFRAFNKMWGHKKMDATPLLKHELKELKKDDDKSFDWRDHGAVNPVKNQAQCGSCWAFATVANIEGVYFHQHGTLPSLSEQELVSCDTNDAGCNGGLPAYAADYLIRHGVGLESETDYPYTAQDGTCSAEDKKEIIFVGAYRSVEPGHEDDMAAALVQYGPLSIGINADPLMSYTGGIINPSWFSGCSPSGIDHGVAIVGYGEKEGIIWPTQYWIVRNSWSSDWGENGYFRIVRGKGACGLDRMVTTVTETSAATTTTTTPAPPSSESVEKEIIA